MATKIDELTENAADGVATTMEKIDSINIDELNEAISSLDAAVEALRATAEGFAGIFGH